MVDLNYFSGISYKILMPDCKIGKEGICEQFIELLKRQENSVLSLLNWSRKMDDNGIVSLEYCGAPFANLLFSNKIVIEDNVITFTYEEKSNQQVMLPNVFFYVNMLLISMKVAEKVNSGFGGEKVTCSVTINNNTDCFFYEKYSPIEVDYSRMLKYGMAKNANFEIKIECRDDIFLLVNRVYQQFKSSQSVEKPYVSVNKESCLKVYDRL